MNSRSLLFAHCTECFHTFISVAVLSFLELISLDAEAQLSYGGEPISFGHNVSLDSAKVLDLTVAREALKSFKAQAGEDKASPLTIAYPIPVDLSPSNSGAWERLANGTKIWRLVVKSQGALSINLIFDKFHLPSQSTLFIYNRDRSCVLGAYTASNNYADSLFATIPVPGCEVIVEYNQPSGVTESPILHLSAVNHDFYGFYTNRNLKALYFNASGSCERNVSCDEIAGEIPQKRAVCMMLVNGINLCTGTLVNNTTQDGKPYLLTASHCFPQGLNTSIFFYNWESPHCSAIEGQRVQTTSGSTMRVFSEASDITLLELNEKPIPSYRPYLSGWNLAATVSDSTFGIHHPRADVKKISHSSSPLTTGTYGWMNANSHWVLGKWDIGATEGGSSGSALFDMHGSLVGTLTGGASSCSYQFLDFYAKIRNSWRGRNDSTIELGSWLDANGVMGQDSVIAGMEMYPDQKVRRLSAIFPANVATTMVSVTTTASPDGLSANQVAQRFDGYATLSIEGIYLYPAKLNYSATSRYVVRVLSGGSTPENVIFTSEAMLLSSLKVGKENYLHLPQPVTLSGNFFIALQLINGISSDTLAIYQSDTTLKGNGNGIYLNDGYAWNSYGDINGRSGNLWLDIDASKIGDLPTFLAERTDAVSDIYVTNISNKVTVHVGDQSIRAITLIDLTGRVVSSLNPEKIIEGSLVVDNDNLVAGIYLVKVDGYERSVTRKLLIRK